MFIRPGHEHELVGNPLNQLVAPRPIGWISSVSATGVVNLAPFSYFNLVGYLPPRVMFAATGSRKGGGLKDSVSNIKASGEFVVNLATWELREAVNISSAPLPAAVDEFAVAGVTQAPSRLVGAPCVAESPVHLECVLTTTVALPSPYPERESTVVIGEVIGMEIADDVIRDGRVDIRRLQPIARLGYHEYTRVVETFEMPPQRSSDPAKVVAQAPGARTGLHPAA